MPTRHSTLVANVVSTVSVTGDYPKVAVLHTGNVAADVVATTNGVTPVADANDTYVIPSGSRRTLAVASYSSTTGTSSVKLLSTGAVKVEVEFA